ncbi:carbohydrate ABC transporter permease [Paenibacillus nasutitermitis]|uniref:Protein LplC n=1 Tax=Paenibacillus nasutitermitis TaxID=1652958 RepID=A0A917DPK0_9BACL|nr:carbohydrate ABC transporter permease [Paenibacillus nasutitermitis]GGD56838.1 protein LplC [Paenibacillus nasutitermitis]
MRKVTKGMRIFQLFNVIFLGLVGSVSIIPIVNVWAQSFSGANAILNGKVLLWPVNFTLINYDYVLHNETIWRAFAISIFLASVGTMINLVMTSSLAYPLSRPEYRGSRVILLFIMFTMIFSAPLVPVYLWIKQLQLLDTLWVLIIPGAISAFNFFVMRSFFQSIPSELIDSGRMDGCGEARILWGIVLPLTKPVMATIGLFYAVNHWNNYTSAVYFINDRKLYPLQVKVQEIISNASMVMQEGVSIDISQMTPEGIKMAVVLVSALPMIIVYPFLQRYFVKGLLIGSIKS